MKITASVLIIYSLVTLVITLEESNVKLNELDNNSSDIDQTVSSVAEITQYDHEYSSSDDTTSFQNDVTTPFQNDVTVSHKNESEYLINRAIHPKFRHLLDTYEKREDQFLSDSIQPTQYPFVDETTNIDGILSSSIVQNLTDTVMDNNEQTKKTASLMDYLQQLISLFQNDDERSDRRSYSNIKTSL